jgi:hypothetical protein
MRGFWTIRWLREKRAIPILQEHLMTRWLIIWPRIEIANDHVGILGDHILCQLRLQCSLLEWRE